MYIMVLVKYMNNKKVRRLHAELYAEIESVDLVCNLGHVDVPFIDDI